MSVTNQSLPEMSEYDWSIAAESCGDEQSDAGEEVVLLVTLLRQLLVEDECWLNNKNQSGGHQHHHCSLDRDNKYMVTS